ncbi:MAG: hypothetical protein HUU56_14755 [Bdellovibrionaceae bacterium]|nr:hypothetical protein [Pseudobdellovibrionaceae bacterium]
MKKKIFSRYFFYLICCLLTIPSVILIFTYIQPKNLAAIFAGGLFISLSSGVLAFEFYLNKKQKKISLTLIGTSFFLLLFSLPMFITRMVNFQSEFSTLTVLFIPANQFHRLSNYGFILMVVLILMDWISLIKMSKKISPN